MKTAQRTLLAATLLTIFFDLSHGAGCHDYLYQ